MKNFNDLLQNEELVSQLARIGFKEPTETQMKVIPAALTDRDLMVSAETGSGKTGAFGIPLVLKLLEKKSACGLILTPTRELAHQVADFLRELTKDYPHFFVTSIVGGAEMRKQIKALKKNPRIIVATPGRLNDHLRRGTCRLNRTEFLVLDEGDRMIDMGFAPQLEEILEYVPEERQTSLFSATLPKKVQELASKYLNSPQLVQMKKTTLPVESIRQSVVQLKEEEKENCLVEALENRVGGVVIVFVKTKRRADKLAQRLNKMKFNVEVIHGDRSQGQRNRAIQNFKTGRSQILCATDVAARGIDIPSVELVVNYDFPMADEDYIHRIGRTGRNGAQGEAISLVTLEEGRYWNNLAKKYQIKDVRVEESRSSRDNSFRNRRFQKKRPARFRSRFRQAS